MLLPTKGIAADRCLITLGAEILETVERPMGLSAVWESLRNSRATDGQAEPATVTFDWFSLAITALYAMNALEIDDNGTLRRHHVFT
ncbi:ABC-three component system middle component 6 [Mycobacterium sp. E3298]|uniref:ABC-three component system middle component 6 n=1 Tax=Mycobacterium sp. E3298 TaxID=1856865 RepID=UPI0012EA57C1|nr:ABC-three component system middle component 6 [Mycobacterium sp. E3298]